MAQKRPFFTSKLPIPWHHGVAQKFFPAHLHSFDGPIAMDEQQPSLETPTWQTNIVVSF